MPRMQKTAEAGTRLILKQSRLAASEVARAEAIVDHALGVAVMSIAATRHTGDVELAETAIEVLQTARDAATKILQAAKKEVELTLSLARSLAISRRIDEDVKRAATTPNIVCS